MQPKQSARSFYANLFSLFFQSFVLGVFLKNPTQKILIKARKNMTKHIKKIFKCETPLLIRFLVYICIFFVDFKEKISYPIGMFPHHLLSR